MKHIGPNVNSYGGSLNDLKDLDFQNRSENIDPPPGFCDQPPDNQNNIGLNNPDDWMQDLFINKTGNGQENNSDPFQRGQIVNDLNVPNRNTIYRYAKSIRGTDEAVMDLFRNIVVIDDDGKAHPVPVIWATQERAVAAVVQENVRKDDTLVVDRIKLPMLAISSTDFTFNQERYTYHKALNWLTDAKGKPTFTVSEKYNKDTVFGVARGIPIDIGYNLIAWTMQLEDMNQIIEQIVTKFSPMAYIKVRGVTWETGVKLNSIANNLETEPGDQALRVIKFQFGLTAETYVAQPIRREKAILETRVEIGNSAIDEQISEIVSRIEESSREFKND